MRLAFHYFLIGVSFKEGQLGIQVSNDISSERTKYGPMLMKLPQPQLFPQLFYCHVHSTILFLQCTDIELPIKKNK